MVTIDDARQFIIENESFFKTPLHDQETFIAFYQQANALDEIKNYSTQLAALLYKHSQQLTPISRTPVYYAWREEHFEPALAHEEICQFLIDNKDHPAVILWRQKEADERLLRKKEFSDLITQLANQLSYLAAKINAGNANYTSAAMAANTLIDELTASGKDFFSKPLSKQSTTLFLAHCCRSIDNAESEFKQHRGFWHKNINPIAKQILGLIASLFTLPVLLISSNYRNTVIDTFFTPPKTHAVKELDAFKGRFFCQEDNDVDHHSHHDLPSL